VYSALQVRGEVTLMYDVRCCDAAAAAAAASTLLPLITVISFLVEVEQRRSLRLGHVMSGLRCKR